jgi:DNA-binding NtrC family response regulator
MELVGARGYRASVAGTAADVMTLVEIDRPDAIVLNIELPDARRTMTLDRLRGVRPNVPIVMLTGNADEAIARTTLKRGAFDYISKPFAARRVVAVLEAAVDARL